MDVFTEVASLGLYYGYSTWLSQWRNLARQGRIRITTTTVKSQKTEKTAPPANPATAPRRKFLSLLRYQLLIDVIEMRVKNITVTVSVRVSVTVRVSLVLFVCITVSVRVSAMVRVSLV